MKRWRLLVTLMLTVIYVSGCSVVEQIAEYNLDNLDTVDEKETEDIIRLPESDYVKEQVELSMYNPHTLNPLEGVSYSVDQALRLVYESLYSIDANYDLIPCLARDSGSVDGLSVTIQLDSSHTFSTGEAVTADDVIYSFERIKDEPNSGYHYVIDYISQISAIDESTIRVTYNQAHRFNAYALTFPVVSRNYMESETYDKMYPVGSGNYMLEDSQSMLYMTLAKREDRRTVSGPAKIQFNISRQFSDSYNMFLAKRVDVFAPETTHWDRYSDDMSITTIDYESPYYYNLLFNTQRAYFASSDARRYIASIIDYERIQTQVFLGHLQPRSLPIYQDRTLEELGDPYALSNGKGTYYASLYKMDLAEQYKPNAIEDDAQILRGIYNETDTYQVALVQVLKNDFSAAAIPIDWIAYDENAYSSALKEGNFDIACQVYQMSIVPEVDKWLMTGGIMNYGGYTAIGMDGLVANFTQVNSDEQWLAKAEALSRLITEELPYIPLGQLENGLFIHDQVSGRLRPSYYSVYNGMDEIMVKQ